MAESWWIRVGVLVGLVVVVLGSGCLGTDHCPVTGVNESASNPSVVTGSVPPPPPPRVIKYGPAISAGLSHCLALCENGTVVAWPTGQDGDAFGQCDVPPGLANVTAIAAGTFHSVALRENGTVITWGQGWDDAAQPAIQNATAISAGGGSCLALLENGTVVEWGCCHDLFVPVAATGVAAISAGREHNLALLENGSVVAWGNNESGACDVLAGLTNVTAIAAGSGLSAAALGNGSVVTWGANWSESKGVPVWYSDVGDVKAIDAGCGSVLVLFNDGTTACLSEGKVLRGGGGGVKAISVCSGNPMWLYEDDTVEYFTNLRRINGHAVCEQVSLT